jgi:alkylation response protein AidB-like acyl-CoA dehydrogenase
MHPYLTAKHLALRDEVAAFAREKITPVAAELDESCEFPWENVKAMAEMGLLGVPVPKELGGMGLDYLSYILVVEEIAKADASHAITISAHTTLGTSPILAFGTDEQKAKWVPPLAKGKVLGGFGLTEPGAGSDSGGTRTRAVREGNGYRIRGSKIFITHAGVGEIHREDPGVLARLWCVNPRSTSSGRANWAAATTTGSSSSRESKQGRRKTRWAGGARTRASC